MSDKIKEYLDKKMTQARREKAINLDMVTLIKMVEIYREATTWISKQPRDQSGFSGSKAREAEQKAEELLK